MGDGICIHVMHTGSVCVSPELPYGGERCNPVKASGVFAPKSERLWLPVSAYLIEHPKGKILVDTGWERGMSPRGIFDKKAQITSLGSRMLYTVNQGVLPDGEAVDEQLSVMGVRPEDLDYVLLTHLDCDHANGLSGVRAARHILCSADELAFAHSGGPTNRVRYQDRWWSNTRLETFAWDTDYGPFRKAYDLFGDGSVLCVSIPGHSKGLFAVRIQGWDGHFALLFSDGGYSRRSWEDMVLSGIADNRAQQKASLSWIREQSLDPLCVESLANHDPDVQPHVIEL